MKQIFSLVLVVFISMFLVNTASASENDGIDFDLSNAEITYQDDEITVISFGNDPEIAKQIQEYSGADNSQLIQPLVSQSGPGGFAKIEAYDTGRAIFWTVKPATAWPWIFNGKIELRYHSGFKRDAWITGSGPLGLSTSGMVTMNKNNGGYATL